MYVINPDSLSDSSNTTDIEQNIESNQKYTGPGFIPEYDGYIS